jgi:hypothetical protein
MKNVIPFPGPRQLPKITWKGTVYFIDSRLGQIRNVDNPGDFVDFRDLPDELMCAIYSIT